jgi:hypothetical protein
LSPNCCQQASEGPVLADAADASLPKKRDAANSDDLSTIVFELKMELAGLPFFKPYPGCNLNDKANFYNLHLFDKRNPVAFREGQQDRRTGEAIEKGSIIVYKNLRKSSERSTSCTIKIITF